MPRPRRGWLQATSFRLALAQAAVFLALFVAAGAVGLVTLHRAQAQALDASISAQAEKLEALGEHAGPAALLRALGVLQHDTDDWEVRLTDPRGRKLGGDLPDAVWPLGFADRTLVEGDRAHEPPETIRARTQRLADGALLTLGRDLGPLKRADAAAAAALSLAALLTVVSALALGWWVSRRALRRLDEMDAAVSAFAGGDLHARVGAPQEGRSDLDALSSSVDAMLDRIAELTEGLRRVSASVAHDLKRPLIRHNQEIAEALEGPAEPERLRIALEAAARRTDEALAVFDTMLRLAELDAGAPALPREPVDLRAVAARVVAAYAPRAEDEGRSLALVDGFPAVVRGDARLLGLVVANLVDNALVHTSPGARVEVRVTPTPPRLAVWDDGQGVPAEDLEAIFRPFHRGDRARTSQGAGLGLALVASAAKALRARASARFSQGGFEVEIVFEEDSSHQ